MVELLIAVSAAVFAAAIAIVALVSWAVRREDACLSMAETAPGRLTGAVRRLLGLYVTGVTGPARPARHGDLPAPGGQSRDEASRTPAYRG